MDCLNNLAQTTWQDKTPHNTTFVMAFFSLSASSHYFIPPKFPSVCSVLSLQPWSLPDELIAVVRIIRLCLLSVDFANFVSFFSSFSFFAQFIYRLFAYAAPIELSSLNHLSSAFQIHLFIYSLTHLLVNGSDALILAQSTFSTTLTLFASNFSVLTLQILRVNYIWRFLKCKIFANKHQIKNENFLSCL